MTTSIKTCFKCGAEKPLHDFYRHPAMSDGHLGKCKECTKIDVRANRKKNVDYYREYNRGRGSRQTAEYAERYKRDFPEKVKAQTAVNNAVRDGKLKKAPCAICGREDVHGHHDNYARPLDVVWLCPPHHFERHKRF